MSEFMPPGYYTVTQAVHMDSDVVAFPVVMYMTIYVLIVVWWLSAERVRLTACLEDHRRQRHAPEMEFINSHLQVLRVKEWILGVIGVALGCAELVIFFRTIF